MKKEFSGRFLYIHRLKECWMDDLDSGGQVYFSRANNIPFVKSLKTVMMIMMMMMMYKLSNYLFVPF